MKLQHEATTNSLDMGLVEKGKVRIKKKTRHTCIQEISCKFRDIYMYIYSAALGKKGCWSGCKTAKCSC